MIKGRSLLVRGNAFGIGLYAACLALACGKEDGASSADPTSLDPGEDEPVDECITNPYIEDCDTDAPGAAPPGQEPAKAPPSAPPARGDTADLLVDQVQNILLANCGGCHGTQLTKESANAGMNYIDDMEQLVFNRQVLPLDAENSPIIQRMRNGSMPPTGRAVSSADINFIANFINDADNWPDLPQTVCDDNPPLDFDELYEAVARDLSDQERRDQPFIRYLSLDNRAAAGVCIDTALDLDRQGLTKLVNMLSIDANVVRPEPVNREQTLFRVDMRDLRWDRPIEVEGQAFDDVWEAIIAFNAYAVPFEGDAADDAREDSQTAVPVMFLDSMLDVAAIGNLYYAIIGVDVNETLDTFVAEDLGIDVAENLENEDLVRAGTTKSRISRQDRLIEGHEIEVRPGVYYQSFDFADDQNESIFQNPFGFNEGGREAIFTLPNGMLAYLVADENGNLVQDSEILLDTSQNNYRAVTSVSCARCHAGGLIPVADEVRPVVESIAITLLRDGTLNQDQLQALPRVYLEADAFERRLAEDSNAFYLNALRQANLPVAGAEPVSSVFLRFDRDLTSKDAASVLGVSDAELVESINLLDPALGVLRRGGTIDRDDFTAQYVESLCILSAVNENRPEDALCDEVLGDP